MIVNILTEWNVLTATLVAWLATVSLTIGVDVAVDVVPDYYRKTRARAQLMKTFAKMAEQRQAAKPITFNPDATMQLGVFKIQPAPVRRRHAAA